MKRILTTGVAAAALTLGVSAAQAGSFQLREQGASALAQSFAGVAAGSGGLASMFWNPATMTDFAGWQSSWNMTGILASSKTTVAPGTHPLLVPRGDSGDIGQSAILPATYTSYQFNDNLWFGLAINTPYGLVTKNNQPSAASIYGATSKTFSTNIQPTIAYKINDYFSVAAGLQIEYFKVRLTSLAPPSGPGYVQLNGNSWGLGYTLGATFKPLAGTEIGIGYRSRVQEKLSGSLEAFPRLPASVSIKSNTTLPDELTIGIQQKINDQLTLSAGFEWTHWSLFNSFPVVISSPATLAGVVPTNLAFRYRNGWYASVGGAYKWNDALTLKAGLGYERSPITDITRGVRVPDADRFTTSIGASYAYSQKISVDVSYAHSFFKKAPITIANASNPAYNALVPLPFVGRNRTSLDFISVGLNYRWDDPKVAIPVAPIVRKY